MSKPTAPYQKPAILTRSSSAMLAVLEVDMEIANIRTKDVCQILIIAQLCLNFEHL
jgi:hypothetical protein